MRWPWVVLALTLPGCGPSAEALLDWSRAVSPTPAPAAPLPALTAVGATLRAGGAQVRLRGLNVCSLEFDAAGATWRLDDADGGLLAVLADPLRWNANVVRVPVNQQWFNEDEAYVARVERVIDRANDLGLYVVLDVQWEHAAPTEPYSDNILPVPTFGTGNTTEAFWLEATSRWANRTNLLLDLINEPHARGDDETAAAMQALVDAIRTRDAAHLIVVGGMDWAHGVGFYAEHPLSGQGLVYSAHQYLPYDPPEAFDAAFGHVSALHPVLIGELLADPSEPAYALRVVDAAERAGAVGWLPWAIGCGFDEDADLRDEPLSSLAARLRALNP